MIKIKCFGMSREIAAEDGTLELNVDSVTVGKLRNHLTEKYGSQLSIEQCMIAVNEEYALDDQLIASDDEIAIIPPVSGG